MTIRCKQRMDSLGPLKTYLLERALVSEGDMQRAEDYALTMNIPLDQALVFLELVNFQDLGGALAELYKIPYEPLLPSAPPPDAMEKLPLKLAERYTLFPVNYDPKTRSLIIATPNPRDPSLAELLARVLPQELNIEYQAASAPEIQTAIQVHYKGKPYKPDQKVEIPKGFRILDGIEKSQRPLDLDTPPREKKKVFLLEPDSRRLRAMRTLLELEGYKVVGWASSLSELKDIGEGADIQEVMVNAQAFRLQGRWERELAKHCPLAPVSYYDPTALLMGHGLSYSQMSQTLISFVTFVMKRAIKAEGRALDLVLSRVKYCKLLAFRLGCGAVETDALVLACWLSGSRLGTTMLKQLATPYRLEEILAKNVQGREEQRIERAIYLLVTTYQSLKKKAPQKAGDIKWLRKNLLARFSPSKRERLLVEKFLTLLRDEEFLKGLDGEGGKILVVDPDFAEDSSLVLRLNSHGFQVIGARNAKEAVKLLLASHVDLVISELVLPGTDGITFLKAMRKNQETASIPFFFLTSERDGRLAAQCLEAGAEEFFTKPVDLDLLYVKIQRVIAKRSEEPGRGITGSLADMSAMEIIQSVATGEKDVEIRLESNCHRGSIYIQRGEIIHAELRYPDLAKEGLAAEEILYRLMALKEGRFQILSCSEFPERTIFGSTMSLLMEGARVADEMASRDRT